MTQQYHNPFAGIELIAPLEQRDDYDRYCQTGEGRAVVDQSPFPRKVDFWFTGLSLGARKQLKPVELKKNNSFHFINGDIFDRDSWRVQAVMLIAIATEENVEIVGNARRTMAIANGLAAAGIQDVVDMLQNGKQEPIWNLSESLNEILQK